MLRYTMLKILFASTILILSATIVSAGQPNWQLVLGYDGQSLQLIKADRIPAVSKQVQTPGLKAAPIRLQYTMEWLTNDAITYSSITELPLGIRSTLGENEPCRSIIPEQGVIVIRVEGPDEKLSPQSLRLSQPEVKHRINTALSLPAPFENDSWTFPLPSTSVSQAPADGPISGTKIRDTGPDWNRLVIVIMGDGYTAANLSAGQFESAAGSLGNSMEVKPPWDVLFAATNMYRVDIESNEEGADHETYGVLKDTYLNSSFWVADIERLLALTGTGYTRAVAAADAMVGPGVWDIILVLVNSTKYGGSGGSIAVSSVHSSASEIILHELGHTFANLADEYETAYPGYPPGDSEPNVDFDYDGPGLKWLAWVSPGTPLPTPESSPYLTTVGAFEGARYLSTGIYRPWYNCLMRALGRPFCPICKEAHVIEFTNIIMLVDDYDPYPGTSHNIGTTPTTFTVTPLPFDDLGFEWTLDGTPIPGATGPTLELTSDQMTSDAQTLALNITFYTQLVRLKTISSSYTWNVNQADPSCCTGIVGDANYDGGYEPTISDISVMVDHLFITGIPLTCYEEADVNQSGGISPTASDITIGDISTLVDYLFISGTPLPNCI